MDARDAEIARLRAELAERDRHLADVEAGAERALAEAEAALESVRAAKDAAYAERNRLVALLARIYPGGIARTAIEGWDPAWHGCVYLDLPTGQASWHFHDRDAPLFEGLPAYAGAWDGHSTDGKYRRVAALASALRHRWGD